MTQINILISYVLTIVTDCQRIFMFHQSMPFLKFTVIFHVSFCSSYLPLPLHPSPPSLPLHFFLLLALVSGPIKDMDTRILWW